MITANRPSNDKTLIWVTNTTKTELKTLGIKVYCIASVGYSYVYQIKKTDLPENLRSV